MITIFLGADHRGFQLKEDLKKWLNQEFKSQFDLSMTVVDCGNQKFDQADDYIDYALLVAARVAAQISANQADSPAVGIVICGSGVGVNVVANKVAGIRASLIMTTKQAIHARQWDDINVLALGSNYLTLNQAKNITAAFLQTDFLAATRMVRRINKVKAYEDQHFSKNT